MTMQDTEKRRTLSPRTEQALAAFARENPQLAADLRARLTQTPEEVAARAARLQALFAAWAAEDVALDPVEAAADWEDLQRALNANRAAAGEEPLFP